MQSTKTASITDVVSVSADEVRALVGVAAKRFVGVVDGEAGVKLLSSDVTLREDGTAEVAIVYQRAANPVRFKADEVGMATEKQATQDGAVPPVVPLTLNLTGAAPGTA